MLTLPEIERLREIVSKHFTVLWNPVGMQALDQAERPVELEKERDLYAAKYAAADMRWSALEKENARLRKTLHLIAGVNACDFEYQKWARAALEGK